MPDAFVLAIVAVLIVLIIGRYVVAGMIRGRFISWMLGRVARDINQVDVIREVTGAPAAPPRNFRETLFAAMSGKAPAQPAAWRRRARKGTDELPK